ncbi:MAG TPA: DUF131 domain-containing protein [Euryarchaeota archaeon]|nr:DUF131 domain-containing protein [Euryarchaeota archaeon]
MKSADMVLLGLVLIIIGMIVIFFGLLSGGSSKESGGHGGIKGGGVIMIGPIPIIFGSDSQSVQTVVLFTIVLIVVGYLFFRRI